MKVGRGTCDSSSSVLVEIHYAAGGSEVPGQVFAGDRSRISIASLLIEKRHCAIQDVKAAPCHRVIPYWSWANHLGNRKHSQVHLPSTIQEQPCCRPRCFCEKRRFSTSSGKAPLFGPGQPIPRNHSTQIPWGREAQRPSAVNEHRSAQGRELPEGPMIDGFTQAGAPR